MGRAEKQASKALPLDELLGLTTRLNGDKIATDFNAKHQYLLSKCQCKSTGLLTSPYYLIGSLRIDSGEVSKKCPWEVATGIKVLDHLWRWSVSFIALRYACKERLQPKFNEKLNEKLNEKFNKKINEKFNEKFNEKKKYLLMGTRLRSVPLSHTFLSWDVYKN